MADSRLVEKCCVRWSLGLALLGLCAGQAPGRHVMQRSLNGTHGQGAELDGVGIWATRTEACEG